MKIAISINTTWNIYNFRLGLIKALLDKGYEVYAISPYDEYAKKLEGIGVKHIDIKINNKGTNPIEDIKLIKSYYKIFKTIKPDVILFYTIKPNIYGSLAAVILGIPVISNISGLGTVFLNNNLSSKIARLLYKVALKIPKKVFFQNSYDKDLFIKLKLVDVSKTDIIPGSGINTNKFKPLQVISNNDSKKIKFLFIGRLLKDKGLIEYVEAARAIRNGELKFENRELEREIYKNIEFHILGAFYSGNPTAITENEMEIWEKENIVKYLETSDNVKVVIANYDCIVLPSYREGLSRVLLEAASMAKPIIATNVPGCKEVVENGVNGFLCKVKDSNDLAKKMIKIFNLSKEERIKMGQAGREKVIKEFDEKIVIDKYMEEISNWGD